MIGDLIASFLEEGIFYQHAQRRINYTRFEDEWEKEQRRIQLLASCSISSGAPSSSSPLGPSPPLSSAAVATAPDAVQGSTATVLLSSSPTLRSILAGPPPSPAAAVKYSQGVATRIGLKKRMPSGEAGANGNDEAKNRQEESGPLGTGFGGVVSNSAVAATSDATGINKGPSAPQWAGVRGWGHLTHHTITNPNHHRDHDQQQQQKEGEEAAHSSFKEAESGGGLPSALASNSSSTALTCDNALWKRTSTGTAVGRHGRGVDPTRLQQYFKTQRGRIDAKWRAQTVDVDAALIFLDTLRNPHDMAALNAASDLIRTGNARAYTHDDEEEGGGGYQEEEEEDEGHCYANAGPDDEFCNDGDADVVDVHVDGGAEARGGCGDTHALLLRRSSSPSKRDNDNTINDDAVAQQQCHVNYYDDSASTNAANTNARGGASFGRGEGGGEANTPLECHAAAATVSYENGGAGGGGGVAFRPLNKSINSAATEEGAVRAPSAISCPQTPGSVGVEGGEEGGGALLVGAFPPSASAMLLPEAQEGRPFANTKRKDEKRGGGGGGGGGDDDDDDEGHVTEEAKRRRASLCHMRSSTQICFDDSNDNGSVKSREIAGDGVRGGQGVQHQPMPPALSDLLSPVGGLASDFGPFGDQHRPPLCSSESSDGAALPPLKGVVMERKRGGPPLLSSKSMGNRHVAPRDLDICSVLQPLCPHSFSPYSPDPFEWGYVGTDRRIQYVEGGANPSPSALPPSAALSIYPPNPAVVIERTCRIPDVTAAEISTAIPPEALALYAFEPPPIPLAAYINHLVEWMPCDLECFVLALALVLDAAKVDEEDVFVVGGGAEEGQGNEKANAADNHGQEEEAVDNNDQRERSDRDMFRADPTPTIMHGHRGEGEGAASVGTSPAPTSLVVGGGGGGSGIAEAPITIEVCAARQVPSEGGGGAVCGDGSRAAVPSPSAPPLSYRGGGGGGGGGAPTTLTGSNSAAAVVGMGFRTSSSAGVGGGGAVYANNLNASTTSYPSPASPSPLHPFGGVTASAANTPSRMGGMMMISNGNGGGGHGGGMHYSFSGGSYAAARAGSGMAGRRLSNSSFSTSPPPMSKHIRGVGAGAGVGAGFPAASSPTLMGSSVRQISFANINATVTQQQQHANGPASAMANSNNNNNRPSLAGSISITNPTSPLYGHQFPVYSAVLTQQQQQHATNHNNVNNYSSTQTPPSSFFAAGRPLETVATAASNAPPADMMGCIHSTPRHPLPPMSSFCAQQQGGEGEGEREGMRRVGSGVWGPPATVAPSSGGAGQRCAGSGSRGGWYASAMPPLPCYPQSPQGPTGAYRSLGASIVNESLGPEHPHALLRRRPSKLDLDTFGGGGSDTPVSPHRNNYNMINAGNVSTSLRFSSLRGGGATMGLRGTPAVEDSSLGEGDVSHLSIGLLGGGVGGGETYELKAASMTQSAMREAIDAAPPQAKGAVPPTTAAAAARGVDSSSVTHSSATAPTTTAPTPVLGPHQGTVAFCQGGSSGGGEAGSRSGNTSGLIHQQQYVDFITPSSNGDGTNKELELQQESEGAVDLAMRGEQTEGNHPGQERQHQQHEEEEEACGEHHRRDASSSASHTAGMNLSASTTHTAGGAPTRQHTSNSPVRGGGDGHDPTTAISAYVSQQLRLRREEEEGEDEEEEQTAAAVALKNGRNARVNIDSSPFVGDAYPPPLSPTRHPSSQYNNGSFANFSSYQQHFNTNPNNNMNNNSIDTNATRRACGTPFRVSSYVRRQQQQWSNAHVDPNAYHAVSSDDDDEEGEGRIVDDEDGVVIYGTNANEVSNGDNRPATTKAVSTNKNANTAPINNNVGGGGATPAPSPPPASRVLLSRSLSHVDAPSLIAATGASNPLAMMMAGGGVSSTAATPARGRREGGGGGELLLGSQLQPPRLMGASTSSIAPSPPPPTTRGEEPPIGVNVPANEANDVLSLSAAAGGDSAGVAPAAAGGGQPSFPSPLYSAVMSAGGAVPAVVGVAYSSPLPPPMLPSMAAPLHHLHPSSLSVAAEMSARVDSSQPLITMFFDDDEFEEDGGNDRDGDANKTDPHHRTDADCHAAAEKGADPSSGSRGCGRSDGLNASTTANDHNNNTNIAINQEGDGGANDAAAAPLPLNTDEITDQPQSSPSAAVAPSTKPTPTTTATAQTMPNTTNRNEETNMHNYLLLCTRSIHRIFLAALLTCMKLRIDKGGRMSTYSNIGGLSTADLRGIEVAFLGVLNFDARISTSYYLDVLYSLRQHCTYLVYERQEEWAAAAWGNLFKGLPLPSIESLAAEVEALNNNAAVQRHKHLRAAHDQYLKALEQWQQQDEDDDDEEKEDRLVTLEKEKRNAMLSSHLSAEMVQGVAAATETMSNTDAVAAHIADGEGGGSVPLPPQCCCCAASVASHESPALISVFLPMPVAAAEKAAGGGVCPRCDASSCVSSHASPIVAPLNTTRAPAVVPQFPVFMAPAQPLGVMASQQEEGTTVGGGAAGGGGGTDGGGAAPSTRPHPLSMAAALTAGAFPAAHVNDDAAAPSSSNAAANRITSPTARYPPSHPPPPPQAVAAAAAAAVGGRGQSDKALPISGGGDSSMDVTAAAAVSSFSSSATLLKHSGSVSAFSVLTAHPPGAPPLPSLFSAPIRRRSSIVGDDTTLIASLSPPPPLFIGVSVVGGRGGRGGGSSEGGGGGGGGGGEECYATRARAGSIADYPPTTHGLSHHHLHASLIHRCNSNHQQSLSSVTSCRVGGGTATHTLTPHSATTTTTTATAASPAATVSSGTATTGGTPTMTTGSRPSREMSLSGTRFENTNAYGQGTDNHLHHLQRQQEGCEGCTHDHHHVNDANTVSHVSAYVLAQQQAYRLLQQEQEEDAQQQTIK